jgi:hypothetical protein
LTKVRAARLLSKTQGYKAQETSATPMFAKESKKVREMAQKATSRTHKMTAKI